jgi:hypothetical protein
MNFPKRISSGKSSLSCPLQLEKIISNEVHQILALKEWKIGERYGRLGESIVRYMYEGDLICNIGNSADFARIDPDGNEVWRTTCSTIHGYCSYYPKIANGILFYADYHFSDDQPGSNTIFAIRLSDGVLLWSLNFSSVGNPKMMDLGNEGIFLIVAKAGSKLDLHYLNFLTGTDRPGFPVTVDGNTEGQSIGAADIDGDGHDEVIFLGEWTPQYTAYIYCYDHDGTLLWVKTTPTGHTDYINIADCDPANPGIKVLTVETSLIGPGEWGEGYIITLRHALTGEIYRTWTHPEQLHVTAIFCTARPDLEGYQIYYCSEEGGEIGLLDGGLNLLWRKTGLPQILNHGTSNLTVADVDGDGYLELITNMGEIGSNGNCGIMAFDRFGNPKYILHGKGWNIGQQYLEKSTGGPQRDGDYNNDRRDELLPGLWATWDYNQSEIIHMIGYR